MPRDLDKLQGTWRLTSLVADGRKMPPMAFRVATVVVAGSTFKSLGMGADYEGTLDINPKKTPRTFDLTFTSGPLAGTRQPGIYKLGGKTWTICLAMQGGKRPLTFAAKA